MPPDYLMFWGTIVPVTVGITSFLFGLALLLKTLDEWRQHGES